MCIIQDRDRKTKSPRHMYKFFRVEDEKLYSPFNHPHFIERGWPQEVWIKEKKTREGNPRRKQIDKLNPYGFQGFLTEEGLRAWVNNGSTQRWRKGRLRFEWGGDAMRKVRVRDIKATGWCKVHSRLHPVAIAGEMYICSEKETREQLKKDIAKKAHSKET